MMLAYGHDVIAEMAHRDAMVASGLMTVDPDTGEEKLGFKTDDYEVSIDTLDWHRGIFPLPAGKISLSSGAVWRAAKQAEVHRMKYIRLVLDDWRWFFDDPFDFGSAYVEFLYPGSPGYGFHVRHHELISSDWREADSDRDYWVDRFIEMMGYQFSDDDAAFWRANAWIEKPKNRGWFLSFVLSVDMILERACREIARRVSSYLDWEQKFMEEYINEYAEEIAGSM